MRWLVTGFLESLGAEYRSKLEGSYTQEGIEKWFFRKRSRLQGLSPAQAIASGNPTMINEVKQLIDALVRGDFT